MKRRLALWFGVLAVVAPAWARAQVAPHRSVVALPSSNGRAAIAYDLATRRVNQFLEHPYRYPREGVSTRDFAFDAYPGVRIGTTGTWLTEVAPTVAERVTGTNIIHVRRELSGVTLDVYEFAPMTLAENAAVTLVKATRTAGSGPIDIYQLYNLHLGAGSPEPGTAAEDASWSTSRSAFYEYGPSNVAVGYATVVAAAATHHGITPQNPFAALTAGANLADNPGPGGPSNDVVAGLQSSLGDLAIGASAWAGFFVVLAPDAQAEPAVDRVRAWIAGRSPQQLHDDELAGWTSWRTAAPAGASVDERAQWDDAQAVLRMGQVQEPGTARGALLASVAPGKWNIAWVRDMAYATVALVRSGHLAEAKAAIEFQLGARAGLYQQYVGRPYAISITRYYGNGDEETDFNADGPNVEFDGFGLFLWSVDEYLRASSDSAALAAWWPELRDGVASVLVFLQEASGLIAKDSSIWEVHLNGQEEHFAYTTITAAAGLCGAADLAARVGDSARESEYRAAGQRAAAALVTRMRSPAGGIAQSVEALARGRGFLDAAALEAINLGLLDPAAATARATLAAVRTGLRPPSMRGFMRNDDGGQYDSQEWIFIDLRGSLAFARGGDAATASETLAWNVAQGRLNDGLLAELHDRVTANYAGEVPMVGFGAGAYVLALAERGQPARQACGRYASEPGGGDGGVGDAGGGGDAGGAADAGVDGGGGGGGDGCGCHAGGRGRGGAGAAAGALMVALLLGGLGLGRRMRGLRGPRQRRAR